MVTCTISLSSFSSYTLDTYIEVLWTNLLLSKIYVSEAVLVDTQTVTQVNHTEYTCTARVFYNGTNPHVINSNIAIGSSTTLNIPSKYNSNRISYSVYMYYV